MNQTNNTYTLQGNQLIIGDTAITFDFPIAQVIEMKGMFIVRLDNPINAVYNENVFGVSTTEKKIKWQIEKREYNAKLASCPFVWINFLDDQLILNNWCDTYLVVEPQTGKILKEGYTK